MNTPAPNATKPRKLWPWFLGGCLLLVLLAIGAFVAMAWFGMKMMGDGAKQAVSGVPLVQEHFGRVEDVSMDFGGLMEAGQAGQQAMVFRLRGEKGEGRLVITMDPAGGFQSATVTLPNGEVHELDQRALEQLKTLQGGLPPG